MINNIKNKCLKLENIIIDDSLKRFISKEQALMYSAIPIKLENDKIYFAISNFDNTKIIEDLRFICKKEIIPVKVSRKEVVNKITEFYSDYVVEEAMTRFNNQAENYNLNHKIEEDSNIEKAPAVIISNLLIKRAIAEKASDIHIEPFEKNVLVRFRMDGMLYEKYNFPKKIYLAISTRIKIMSNMDIDQKRVPQDGKFSIKEDKRTYDLRVSTMPTVNGEKIVIRILNRMGKKINLKNLGFTKVNELNRLIQKPYGIILIAGPTGSGKSTTLCGIINKLNNSEKNIITIEDPVEYQIYGINQVNVNNKAGLTFAKGLRNILRQDPDIIMIGEIRDEETAKIAISAAITGHLVLSTIHTKDAHNAIVRLKDMGVENYLISNSLIGVVSQRLVRKICPFCKKKYNSSSFEMQILGNKGIKTLYKGEGCEKCGYTGYKGRTTISEILSVDENMRLLINEHINLEKMREYNSKNKFTTLKEDCLELVRNGITSIEELIRVVEYE